MKMTATQLRQDLFRTLDRVLETGEPLEIERNGALLCLQVAQRPAGALDLERFAGRRHLLRAAPAELVGSDWSFEWRPGGGFDEEAPKAPGKAGGGRARRGRA
jgi:hypothetical protein